MFPTGDVLHFVDKNIVVLASGEMLVDVAVELLVILYVIKVFLFLVDIYDVGIWLCFVTNHKIL